MVSELSARLLKGHNITYSTASVRGATHTSSDCSSESSASTSSSNDECSSKPSSNFPEQIADSDSTERFSNRDACFKRRKIDELRFAASRVKEDLAKGGLPFPSIHSKKPRALEGFDNINMSSIQLLGAKSVADSPFLIKFTGQHNSFGDLYDVGRLFSETQKVYSKKWIQGDVSSDWDKCSTGSLTSDSESSCVVDIPPLLEDSLKYKAAEMKTPPAVLASIKNISMANALQNSTEPRMVTLSFAPFLIIHVNAAYTRMTGIGAKDVLGKSLRDVFKDKRCKIMAGNASSLANLHEQLTSLSTMRQDKRRNCSLQVSFVGSTDEEVNGKKPLPTHCMIAFHPTDEQDSNFGTQTLVTSVPTSCDFLHCEVVA